MSQSPSSLRPVVSALALVLVTLAAVLGRGGGLAGVPAIGTVALLAYLLLEGPRAGAGGRVMLGVALAVTGAAAFSPAIGVPAMERGFEAAVFIAGLFTALGFLREAAETSALIRQAGLVLTVQPPGRRYAVLTAGAHLVAQVLNFGVLPLLGTLAVKGNTIEAASGDEEVVRIRKRRMMLALLRGFAAMTAWSPLSVSFAVVTHVVAGVAAGPLIALQIVLAGLLMILGWAEDRLRFRHRLPPVGRFLAPSGFSPLWRLAALVTAVVGAAFLTAWLLQAPMVIGAMTAVPPTAFIWLLVQEKGSVTAAMRAFVQRAGVSLPALRSEVAMLGGAVYVGSVLAAFAQSTGAAGWLAESGLAPVGLAITLSVLVVGLARLGLNQLVTVTILGGMLPDPQALGLDPLVLASGLMGAWALAAGATPMGGAVLSIARLSEVTVTRVVGAWNGVYTLAGLVFLAAWITFVDKMLG